jgi:hypothetical protein
VCGELLFCIPLFVQSVCEFVQKKNKKKQKKKEEQKKKTGQRRKPCAPSLLPLFASFSPCSTFALCLQQLCTRLALLFNFALLFDCANPCIECSLPRTPHSPTTSRFCFSRQSLLQSLTGTTCWLQLTPVCLVRPDKHLITAF